MARRLAEGRGFCSACWTPPLCRPNSNSSMVPVSPGPLGQDESRRLAGGSRAVILSTTVHACHGPLRLRIARRRRKGERHYVQIRYNSNPLPPACPVCQYCPFLPGSDLSAPAGGRSPPALAAGDRRWGGFACMLAHRYDPATVPCSYTHSRRTVCRRPARGGGCMTDKLWRECCLVLGQLGTVPTVDTATVCAPGIMYGAGDSRVQIDHNTTSRQTQSTAMLRCSEPQTDGQTREAHRTRAIRGCLARPYRQTDRVHSLPTPMPAF